MGADLFLRPLFDWRSAVASPYGPASSTTKHVLLTLSLHMSAAGDSCFPTIELLVEESGLSKRAVLTNLKAAAEQGWITKREMPQANTMGWRRIEYFASIPAGVEEKVMAWRTQRRERGARNAPPKRGAPHDRGGASGDTRVVHQVHPSTSRSTSSKENPSGHGVAPYPQDFEQAFKAYPRRAGNNPKRAAFKAWKARISEGVSPAALGAGVARYAAFCTATEKTGTEYVLRASTFFGPDRPFEQGFQVHAENERPASRVEKRCIYTDPKNPCERCMHDGDVNAGVLVVEGVKVALRLCDKHWKSPVVVKEPNVRGPGKLQEHPEVTAARTRFEQLAKASLVPA